MIIKRILKDWGLEVLILSFFILVIIPYGAGITFDSVSFFQAGDNFWTSGKYVHFAADGNMEFAAHRFPLYPIILALFKSIDPDLIAFQVILFTALIAVFRNLLSEIKSPKYFLLLLATYPIFLNHYAIWTEGLYAVLFVWLMIRLKKEENFKSVFWILLLVAMLCLTKMVGIVVVGSLLLAYIISRRFLRGFVVFIVGAAVITIWTLLGSHFLGETARSITYHGLSLNDYWYLIVDFGSWLTPAKQEWIPFATGICLYLVPLIAAIKAWKRRHEVGVLYWFLIIHFYAYVAFIVFSKMLLDASIAFDFRTMFPLMINFIGILIMLQTSSTLGEKTRSKIKYVFPKVIVLILILNISSIWLLRNEGVGYNSKSWSEFAFIEELQEIENVDVFTNDQAALYLYAPNASSLILLPQKKDLYSLESNPKYGAEMDLLLSDLYDNENALIVWIRNGITEPIYPNYEELKNWGNLEILYDDWLCLIGRPTFKGRTIPAAFM